MQEDAGDGLGDRFSGSPSLVTDRASERGAMSLRLKPVGRVGVRTYNPSRHGSQNPEGSMSKGVMVPNWPRAHYVAEAGLEQDLHVWVHRCVPHSAPIPSSALDISVAFCLKSLLVSS